jgi:hypothetical protein
MRALRLHLPLIGLLAIVGFFALLDAGWFPSLRSESTFGWMVLVWYPLCALLGLVQVAIWIRWAVNRVSSMNPGRSRAIITIVLLILAATATVLVAVRLLQRWGAGM